MTSRERVLMSLRHEEPDRIPIHDSPWNTTIERWKKEGLPADGDVQKYFGYEFAGYGPNICYFRKTEILEETEEYRVERGLDGQTFKNWKKKTSTPGWQDFLIKSREDWYRHRHLLEWADDRIDMTTLPKSLEDRQKGLFVYYGLAIGYDRTQCFTGSERLLVALATDPEWVRDMFESNAYLVIRSAEEMMKRGFKFDGALLFDDLGYRNATLFSPEMYHQILQPCHKRITRFFHDHGLPVILHSCGCVKGIVPDLIESGFDCLQPLEVKAGMDLVALKKEFGKRLSFMGGIDVRKMSHPDPRVIEDEIRTKFAVAKVGGGYIYHSDHSVPDDVSFKAYSRVMELVRKYGAY